MANQQHIEWLLEGVEAWNKRFLEGNFTPDFEGANIYWEFRKVGKLDHNGMIPLAGVIFGNLYSSLTYGNDPHSFYDEFVEPIEGNACLSRLDKISASNPVQHRDSFR